MLDRLWLHSAKARIGYWLREEVVSAPLEPILHPSNTRLVWISLFTVLGHLYFFLVWRYGLPQPYEHAGVRLLMAALGLMYLMPLLGREKDISSRRSGLLFSLATWIQLPCFFSWMYWMNQCNGVWLASASAMVLIYFHATDWRLASVGLFTGTGLGWALAQASLPQAPPSPLPTEHVVVLLFALFMGLMLGFSGANLRRSRLLNTLSTMGVMAHELRTPLASVNLMAEVLRNLADPDLPQDKRLKMNDLAARLQNLVQAMNRQIDTQISNAQLQRLPREQVPVMAASLVGEVVAEYPFKTAKERACVQLRIEQDFCFLGSRSLFCQVLSNLLKNALHALAAGGQSRTVGDIRLEVLVLEGRGRIAVSDKGIGVPADQLRRIFEPFFSSQSGAGSGLGLTFCKTVVEGSRGTIRVHSEYGLGATFSIDLPLAVQDQRVEA